MKKGRILAAYIVGIVVFGVLSNVGIAKVLIHFFEQNSNVHPMDQMEQYKLLLRCWQIAVVFIAAAVVAIIALIQKEKFSETFSFKKLSKKHLRISLVVGLLFGSGSADLWMLMIGARFRV